MIRVGLIGLGHWGPNLARNFASLHDCKVVGICDLDNNRLKHAIRQYPGAYATHNADEILSPKRTDAVVISTPTKTHHALARLALERGLHTFVEKPLATSPRECEELIRLAEEMGKVLFVGHVFLYTAAVAKLKDLVVNDELGDLCYISSSRLNLGPVRADVNVLWDLAPHDISIILHLLDATPISVNCQGLAYLNRNVHDICALYLQFPDRKMAIINTSWLDPTKTRLMTVVGSKKMAIYNDIEPFEKIKVFDKGVDVPEPSDSFADFQLSYRHGDAYIPRLVEHEPLKNECQAFIDCVKEGKRPRTDGQNGLDVVRVLYAANTSLDNGGGRVELDTASISLSAY